MVSSKFSGKVIQQPPPICASKPPVPPVVPPPPPWPPATLTAVVHWQKILDGPITFDITKTITLTGMPVPDDYEGHWFEGDQHIFLIVEFTGPPGPDCWIFSEFTYEHDESWYFAEIVTLELKQPFNPDTIHFQRSNGTPWLWNDITLTAP